MKALRSPPGAVAARAGVETARAVDRRGGRLSLKVDARRMLRDVSADNVDELWQRLARLPYVVCLEDVGSPHERLSQQDREHVLAAAESAMSNRVHLLGSGEISLGDSIDWHRDYKSGRVWPLDFSHDIDCAELEHNSDVKFPWELSRLQWLMPAAQAYRLNGDERFAMKTREVLETWMNDNPVNVGVNWSCTMEAAMRILTWTWLFHMSQGSHAWRDASFRRQFLTFLWIHGRFTRRYLEFSAVNGNHCTADAAGLVFAGLFFGRSGAAARWHDSGWNLLLRELPRQVSSDGVDFEGSVPYHRLVTELFCLPVLYREANGLSTPPSYRSRVVKMARFAEAYCRTDGTVPLIGDGDDARALPLGTQSLNDHRYLPAVVKTAWNIADLSGGGAESAAEVFWLLGSRASQPGSEWRSSSAHRSRAFAEAGYYVMRNAEDHVFVDCAPVGLGGRGGHGHNDCLSFEAALRGQTLIVDCGSFVYTASKVERNRFRSTASHNTPAIDGQEINRFVAPENLWNLHYDAVPKIVRWECGGRRDVLIASHSGYQRLAEPVTPSRTFELDHESHELSIRDEFLGSGVHAVVVPLHLHPGVRVVKQRRGGVVLAAGEAEFELSWEDAAEWEFKIGEAEYSPSYGVKQPIVRLQWERRGPLVPFSMQLRPAHCPTPADCEECFDVRNGAAHGFVPSVEPLETGAAFMEINA